MWIKHNYRCLGCDTIMEITTEEKWVRAPQCPCNTPNSKKPRVISLGRYRVDHEIEITPTFSQQSPWILVRTGMSE